MKDIGEIVAGSGRDDQMDVIGHNDEIANDVAVAVEIKQGVFDDFRYGRILEPAFTIALIEPCKDSVGEDVAEFVFLFGGTGFGMCAKPCVAFVSPEAELVLRDGIGEAESDEVRDALFVPVREVALGDLKRRRRGVQR